MENWAAIGNGFFVSNYGNVVHNGETVKQYCDRGYAAIYTPKKEYVHRLVAKAFLGDVDGKHVHHVNRDRADNCVSNLMIVEDIKHKQLHSNPHHGPRNALGHKYICLEKNRGRWYYHVKIVRVGKRTRNGMFAHLEDAIAFRDEVLTYDEKYLAY